MLAVAVIFLALLVVIGILPNVSGSLDKPVASGAKETCCTDFKLQGLCAKDYTDDGIATNNFNCTLVPQNVDKKGWITLGQLVEKVGLGKNTIDGVHSACCK